MSSSWEEDEEVLLLHQRGRGQRFFFLLGQK